MIDSATEQRGSVQQPEHLAAYANLMHEIKRRHLVAENVLRDPGRLLFRPAALDTAYLQVRKILEIIAFGSLVLNRSLAVQIGEAKDYHAEKVLSAIEKKVGAAYPRPIIQIVDPSPGIRADFQNRGNEALSRKEFGKLYGICGDVLHSRNPLRSVRNEEAMWESASAWLEKIRYLLDSHLINIVGDDNLYLVQMNGDVFNEPTVTTFARAAPPST